MVVMHGPTVLRAEAELFHSTAVVDKTHTPGTQNSGQLSNTGLFLNGLYDFNMNSMFTPYVGVGVGFSNVVATNIGSTVNHTALDDNDLELAYQAIGGVAAQINPKWAITADYRYVATLQPTFDTRASGHGTMENASHNVVLGVRYSFGAPAAPMVERPMATPVVHAAPAKNVAAKVAQSYEVFFDFNKATLTPEAKNILASAAADYRAGKYVKVVVTGHTDTVGSAKVNKALSERRAASVKSELAAQGVPPTAVAMRGVGKNDLLVPTADGVREAQNRRAEIVFENK